MICTICKNDKSKTEFNLKSLKTGERYKHCKACQANYRKQSYIRNRNYYLAYAKKNYPKTKVHRNEMRQFIINYKTGKPCKDCNIVYPHYVTDFDHLPENGKDFQIGKHGRQFSKEKLLAEIAKCDLVCSNCHRERTWKRKLADSTGVEPDSF